MKAALPRWTWRRWVVTIVSVWVGLAVLLVAYGAFELNRARVSLQDLQRGEVAATGENLQQNLRSTSGSLSRGHAALDNPIVGVFRFLPFAGRQLTSVTDISGSAATVADAGADALDRGKALTDDTTTNRQELLEELSAIAGETRDRIDDLEYGPRVGLIGPLADVRDQASEQSTSVISTLERVEGAASATSNLFTRDGRYLVVATNNAEMRSGSGMFLSAGILETGGGRIELGEMQTFTDEAPASVQWPEELDALWGWVGRQGDLRNMMLSPRFDVSAPVAADIWSNYGNGEVDGVIVVDPAMLQAVIAATGDVAVDDVTVNSENVLSYLMFDQYRGMDGSDAAQAARREGLSTVASEAFGALNRGEWDPVTLARELGSAANGRHLMVWSRDQSQQQLWDQAGVAGTVEPNTLMLNSVNLAGVKVDQFVDIESELHQNTGANGLDMSMDVTVTNNSPSSGPYYVVGPYPNSGFVAGQYRSVLAVTLPGDSSEIAFEGDPKVEVAGQDGPTKVIGIDVNLLPGESATYTLNFSRPATARYTSVEPSARIPATNWTFEEESWTDEAPKVLAH